MASTVAQWSKWVLFIFKDLCYLCASELCQSIRLCAKILHFFSCSFCVPIRILVRRQRVTYIQLVNATHTYKKWIAP